MKKTLFVLFSISLFSLPIYADDDEHPNPVEEPAEFIGQVIKNTASTVTGAVAGTGEALGNLADTAGTEDEDEDNR